MSKPYSLESYFLANRNIPWIAIMFSIVAAETSTLTLVSIPGLAYTTNFGFLQLVLGFIFGRIFISVFFIPHYFRGKLFTTYELIKKRFGMHLYRITASLFLLTRAAAEGVRVYAVALALSAIFNFSEIYSLCLVMLITLLYTFGRGLPVVIWTDVVQVIIYFCGALFAIFMLSHAIPGGWQTIFVAAHAQHKLQIFDFSWQFFANYTFWSGLIGGAFLSLASHGTDQIIVQRLLAAKNQRAAQLALIMSGVAVFVQFALFLTIGVMLWVFYQKFPPAVAFTHPDRIFPEFIHQMLSTGAALFLVIAIIAAAMANLSAALNSLSSSSVIDFYLQIKPQSSAKHKMYAARIATIFWASVLFMLALLSRHGGQVLEMCLTIMSVTYGSVLGVFMLGILSVRANQLGAMIGMLCGLVINIYLWRCTHIAFTWYVVTGSLITVSTGYLVSVLWNKRP